MSIDRNEPWSTGFVILLVPASCPKLFIVNITMLTHAPANER
jgi:hypothetical protein